MKVHDLILLVDGYGLAWDGRFKLYRITLGLAIQVCGRSAAIDPLNGAFTPVFVVKPWISL